jgi:hypothetical protein
MCASLARSTVLHPGESIKNIALGQEEVYSCAFWLLTMISLRNPWDAPQRRRYPTIRATRAKPRGHRAARGLTQVIVMEKISLKIAGRQSALFQVLLVIVFCPVECRGRDDLRHNWSSVPTSACQLLLGRFCGGLLLWCMIKDD